MLSATKGTRVGKSPLGYEKAPSLAPERPLWIVLSGLYP